jgi:hypothetical protein
MIVDRWHSRFRSPTPLPAAALADWHAQIGEIDDAALLDGLLGEDEWLLIDRLPVASRWRIGESDPRAALQTDLRRALLAALDDPARVVRYAGRRQAWADLLYRAALGDCSRAWAWVGMELLPSRLGRAPDRTLAEAAERLAREPELVWPVLRRLLAAETERAAFTALLRALPGPAWLTLLAAVPQVAPYLDGAPRTGPDATSAATHGQAWPCADAYDRPGLDALLAWIGRQAWLARRHADGIAPLLAALTWPGAAPDRRAERLQHARAYCLATPMRPTPGGLQPTGRTRTAPADLAAGPSAPSGPASAGAAEPPPLPPAADLPEAGEALLTAWGGTLFWLGRLADSGVLDEAARQPQALPQFLAALADRLGVPADDPVRRVLLGDGRVEAVPAPPAERAAALCAGWAAWLDEAAPDLPPPRLEYVCRRPGRLLIEPGWVELVLPLDGIETAIRRLGLDLDPGWLPWLGCVLRFRYE